MQSELETPKLPIRARGEIYRRGWIVPTLWIVASDGRCYINDGIGGPICIPVTVHFLLDFMERENDFLGQNAVREALAKA